LLVFEALGFGAEPTQKVNVLFLVLDQLQADRLHCYGNPRETSPNIDQLAQRGVLFKHYYTVGPWTSPSFASLHTSLYPSRHGISLEWKPGPGVPLIDKDTPMMVPVFKDHGYYTTAFVNNAYDGEELSGRGFDEYFQYQRSSQLINIVERAEENGEYPLTGIATTRNALAWLDRHKSEKFFLYIHFMEPHSPYNPPPEDDLFKSDAYPYLFDKGHDIARAPAQRLAMLGDQKAIERLYQLYDGKIHFIDRYVARILEFLRSNGLEDNTLVVLTSDHGELLFSHPKDYQTADHVSLYDTNLHIPFIIAGPGVPKGRIIDALASNIDTAPTTLALTGLPPLADAQGQSLVPLIRGTKESLNPYIYLEQDLQPPERAVRTLHYKLIRDLWTGKDRLFDEDRDPRELRDVIQQEPQVANDLRIHLEKWMKENQPSKDVELRRIRVFTAPITDVVIDNQTIESRFLITGEGWHSDTEPRTGNYNVGSFWTEPGDGSRTAIWRAVNPMLGKWKISVFFGQPSVSRLATNAPFTVITPQGSETIHVDLSKGGGQWHLLGTFLNPRYLTVSNAADGAIVADTAKFELVSPE
jgi:arylsulfatase